MFLINNYNIIKIMQLKKLKPVTNGTRHQINLQKNLLSKTNKLLKKSLIGNKFNAGRSTNTGRITVWHKGGRVKRLYRLLDFSSKNSNAITLSNMYDPNRSSFVSLNFDLNNFTFFRTISTGFVYPGSLISCSGEKIELRLGNRTKLKNIPTGSIIHSVSSGLTNSVVFARSAGTYCQIIQKGLSSCKIRLPSGVVFTVPNESFATLGLVSNPQHNLTCVGKAGRNRLKGIRPTVRGIAMNPVDHPHGGRTNGGRPSVTPWGVPTKGKPTVLKKHRNYE